MVDECWIQLLNSLSGLQKHVRCMVNGNCNAVTTMPILSKSVNLRTKLRIRNLRKETTKSILRILWNKRRTMFIMEKCLREVDYLMNRKPWTLWNTCRAMFMVKKMIDGTRVFNEQESQGFSVSSGVAQCCKVVTGSPQKKYRVGPALVNPNSWSYYLNCVLQSLVHTVPLALKLLNSDHRDLCFRAHCCYCLLISHAHEATMMSGEVLLPVNFIENIHWIRGFKKNVQQDAHEYLTGLFQLLDESSTFINELGSSICEKTSGGEYPSIEEHSIVKDVFGL
uniref:Peptidase C19 ubiquitin carboxyl-terminal hydrolase domain-containing protein n=1 Tax=Arundo donax TaxID=35708 RepID=A0A0A9D7C7_ARUDO